LVALTVLGLLYGVCAAIGFVLSGGIGVAAATLAAAACLLGTLSAVAITNLIPASNQQQATYNLLAGSLLRMMIPLAVCLAVTIKGQHLVAGGFIAYLLVMYLTLLVLETLLATRTLRRADPAGGEKHG